MKPILTGFAALMLTAAPLMAQTQVTGDDTQETTAEEMHTDTNVGTYESDAAGSMDYAGAIRTRDITGGEIYSTAGMGGEWSADTRFDRVDTQWTDVGEIEDIVLNRDGRLTGVVAEVGGFLDIADKHVILNIERMRLVPVDDRSYAIVTDMTEEELESLEAVDEGFWN
ncbi:hypothetical protein OB2597_02972 [Pseudooceanicola batsensis HTCC2597]|uniref:PRC-barrel domain-containing protein n=1 Tax=Pseudooceanicola batsensis (strain ATCC BAA-863 / DSM 15984 / KCTC 12145 / HTCC2597) TaxID=252305 RepID=A3TXI8_PSEBH|nr:PRC-barrel domain-containing protein [Pseudooceanicola batsensis]EAQ03548.1 hypothetical protein OB2597_02972 [Pseudooceanicola batsensis HTCC2597]